MNTAHITENSRGGWSIYPPNSARGIGNFASYADAARVADANGWEVA